MKYSNEEKLAEKLVQYGREEETIRRNLKKFGSRMDSPNYDCRLSKKVVFQNCKYKDYPVMKLFCDLITQVRSIGWEAFAITLTQNYIRNRLPYFDDYKIIDFMGTEIYKADLETRKFFARIFQNMKTHHVWTDEEICHDFRLNEIN